jgi:hypothetical protein
MIEIINSIKKYNLWDSKPIDLGFSRLVFPNFVEFRNWKLVVKVTENSFKAVLCPSFSTCPTMK